MPKPTAIVYIDGLNLQRRIVDFLPEEIWVGYWRLVQSVLPNFEIVEVHVFTSPSTTPEVSAAISIWNKQVIEQPNLFFHLGRMKKTTRRYPLTESAELTGTSRFVKILKYEEKGSDVSLAAHMVLDAAQDRADVYLVMTSDTDFEPVLRLLKEKLGVQVGILSTTENVPKLFLKIEPNIIRHVKPRHVRVTALG